MFSITRFSLFTVRLSREVFVLKFSTNASCGPLITISLLGLSILLCLNPFTSISKAIFMVSTKSAQLPELIPRDNIRKFCFFFYTVLRY